MLGLSKNVSAWTQIFFNGSTLILYGFFTVLGGFYQQKEKDQARSIESSSKAASSRTDQSSPDKILNDGASDPDSEPRR